MPSSHPWRSWLLTGCILGGLGPWTSPAAMASSKASSNPSSPAVQPGQPPSTSPRVGEPLQPSSPEQLALSAHLRAKGAVFYGAWWCPACFQQKNLFGKEAGNQLPYVECAQDATPDARCTAAGIRAFPTWDLPGKPRLEGVQSLAELAAWSDFPGTPSR